VISICGNNSWVCKVVVGVGFIAGCSAALLAADSDSITGTVRNQTRGRFVAGAEVILLRLDQASLGQASLNQISLNQRMQEETRTKTDSRGEFTLKVRYPDKLHLVRVIHQGVNYDHRASAGDGVAIAVFDVVSKVQGVTGSIEIIRIGAAGNYLHVSDMVEIKNDSSPPLTQAGERTFEVYLPAMAKIDSVVAAGPGTIAVPISATPVAGWSGHYAVDFPLQPGATKFAFNYDLPYAGQATFRPKNMYPLQQLAVMIPPTMKFASRSDVFQRLRTGNDSYQVEAANLVNAGEGPGFEISGVGPSPALAQSAPKPPVAAQPLPAHSAPANSRIRVSRMPWWVLGASACMLGACVFLLWRKQRLSGNAVSNAAQEIEQRG